MKDFVARASWSNTVGRPDYGDRIYGPSDGQPQRFHDRVPNPGLSLESENYDIPVDWYSGSHWGSIPSDKLPEATPRPSPRHLGARYFPRGLPFHPAVRQAGVTGEDSGLGGDIQRSRGFSARAVQRLRRGYHAADIDS